MYREKNKDFIPIEGSVDGTYQTRGNGTSYNSPTCVTTLHLPRSDKIGGFFVSSKKCRHCSLAKNDCGLATCTKNHARSSKSMEPIAAERLVVHNENLDKAGVRVATLIGDADSSTTAALRRSVGTAVQRGLDLIHAGKSLSKSLWKIKLSGENQLTKVKIEGLRRYHMYAVKSSINNAPTAKRDILKIVPHVFNEHNEIPCGEWCTFDPQKPAEFNPKFIGSPFFHENDEKALYAELTALFQKYADRSKELAKCGSTQGNESFNSMLAGKAKKRQYFGGSRSLHYRVGACTLLKNHGFSWTAPVRSTLHLSEGKHSMKYVAAMDKAREIRKEKQKSPTSKLRRRQLLESKILSNSRTIDRDLTYQKDVELESDLAVPLHPSAKKNETLRKNVPKHKFTSMSKLRRAPLNTESLVYFDLETTGLNPNKHQIIQVVTACKALPQPFCNYIAPPLFISERVSKLTGITMQKGQRFVNKRQVFAHSEEMALRNIIQELEKLERPVLVAHNAQFELRFLFKALQKHNLMTRFLVACEACIDTLPLFKEVYPLNKITRKNNQLGSFVNEILPGYTFQAHNALGDAQALMDVTKARLSEELLAKHCFSIRAYLERAEEAGHFDKLSIALPDIPHTVVSRLVRGKLTLQHMRSLISPQNTGGPDALLKEVNVCLGSVLKKKYGHAVHDKILCIGE